MLYVKWVGVLNKYTAATADKLSAPDSTPQVCHIKYMTALNEMQCG